MRTSTIIREVAAGLVVASVALPLCVAAGTLAFYPLGSQQAAQGAVSGLLCAIAGGTAAALFRRSSAIVTIPTTPIAIVQASSIAALAATWNGDKGSLLAMLPVLVLLAGSWQILFAATGLSQIVKFTPYPVLAGLMTGIAFLMILQQLPTLTGGQSLSDILANIGELRWPYPYVTLFGFALIIAILTLEKTVPRAPTLLIGLLAGFATFHAVRHWFPSVELGSVIGQASISFIHPASPFDAAVFEELTRDFAALRSLIFGSLTLALVGTFDTLFALRTAQQLADISVSPRRDVAGQGAANIVSAMVGGLAVSTSISLLTTNMKSGGRTRLSTITSALALLASAAFIPGIIFALPVVVLAAIIFVVALRLIDRWALQAIREMLGPVKEGRVRASLNLLIVVSVIAATLLEGAVMGAAVGGALSCLIFIIQMSKPVVFRRFTGAVIRSKRLRSLAHNEVLRKYGERVLILELQGVLFFGNAGDLADQLRMLLSDIDIVILDMHRIADVDTSGINVMEQIAWHCAEQNVTLIVCGTNQKFSGMMKSAFRNREDVLFPDCDTALEWAEERVIRTHAPEPSFLELELKDADLTQAMANSDVDIFTGYLKQIRYPKGAILCRAGAPADCIWILTCGSVSIRGGAIRSDRRLASLGPGCSIGEMGMLESKARSADVIADEDVEAYLLTQESFNAILREHPQIGQAILIGIAQQLARRLRDTSEELQSMKD